MWTCETCGREFKNRNQDHYCADQPQTIDAYIAIQEETVRPKLKRIRDTIRSALPDARERMSWSMPTFWNRRNIIHFAAFKKHIGLFPGSRAVEHFSSRLTDFRFSKGTIQLPHNKPLPLDLIAEIARWCADDIDQPKTANPAVSDDPDGGNPA